VQQMSGRDRVVTWAYWAAGAFAAAGAVAPVIFAGGINSRLAGVLIPFAVAAVAMAINALYNHNGRLFTMLLYFVAGVAMVYGVMGMLAVKLTLLVAGSCDPAPAICPPGFQRPLTSSEEGTVNVVVALAILSILAGFYGLLVTYRRWPKVRTPVLQASMPEAAAPAPAVIPPTVAAPVAPPEPAPVEAAPAKAVPAEAVAAEPVGAAPASTPPTPVRSPTRPRAKAKPRPADEPKELVAHAEPKELPAPAEPEELPPAT
jgi:hypothetical protein